MTLKNEPSSLETKRLPSWLNSPWVVIGIFALLVFAVFHQFFFSNGMLFSSDQMSGFDSRFFLKNSLNVYHQFPMWFNSRLAGMPTIDALFGDPFYLPSIIINFFFPISSVVSIKMIFHVFLAGTFFFLLLKKGFGAPTLVALTGGIFYMFNPQFFSHIYPGHDGKMYVIAWLPFIIWRIKVLASDPKLINAALLSFGLSMSLLTAHIQMNYFVLWGLFIYWIVATIFLLSDKQPKQALKVSIFFWSAVAVGVMIAIAQLLPSYLYVKDAFSVRGVDRGFDFAASWSLHWPEVFSLWVPEFVNTLDYYWGANPFKLNSEYTGVIALFLGVLAIISKPNKWRIFWGCIAISALLFALGAHTPLFHIAYYIVPGVKKFRAASMIMFWFSFSVVLLSSMFCYDIIKGEISNWAEKKQKKWMKGLLITNALFILFALIFSTKGIVESLFSSVISLSGKGQAFEINFQNNFIPALWLWVFFATVSIILIISVIYNKIKPHYVILSLLAIGLIDIYRIDKNFIKVVNPQPYIQSEPVLEKLSHEMKSAPFRCYSIPGTLPQNSEGVHQLESVSGFHDNELKWYREFRGDQQDRNYLSSLLGFNENGQPYIKAEMLNQGNPFLNLANVKYILVRSGSQLLSIENKNALGRVSFASNYTIVDTSKVCQSLMNNTYDYRTTVALFKEPDQKIKSDGNPESEFVSTWEKYTPNHRIVKVRVPQDGFLRISETYYPGWEIKIDNKRVSVYQSDLTWMAVNIPRGEHVVEMTIRSIFLHKVMWISITTIVVLWSYILFYFLFLKKRTKSQNV